jgi:hypothetical protein
MTIFSQRGVPAWSRMYQYIESRFALQMNGLPKGTKILMLPVAPNSAWDERREKLRLLEEYRWADQMPGLSWLYVRSAGKRLSEGYGKFLQQAIVTTYAQSALDTELKTALVNLWEEQTYLQGLLNQAIEEAETAYEAYLAITPKPQQLKKIDFYERRGYQTKINVIEQQLHEAGTTAAVLAPAVESPDITQLKAAYERFKQPSQTTSLPINEETLNDPQKWRPLYNSYVGGGYERMQQFLAQRAPSVENIVESSSESSYFNRQWSASVNVNFLGFLRVGGGSISHEETDERVRSDTTGLSVGWENMEVFPIERDTWYSDQIIDTYAPRFSRNKFQEYFGTLGAMEMIPVGLLVARGLRFTLQTSSYARDYSYEHMHASADAGIRIGWYTIGGGGDYSSTKIETRIDTSTDQISFTDLTGRGKVLGVLVKHVASVIDTPKVPILSMLKRKDSAELNRLKALSALQTVF